MDVRQWANPIGENWRELAAEGMVSGSQMTQMKFYKGWAQISYVITG